ncbi:hypothetical protein AMTRI_Chr09g36500 [Amborella trichopoda]|uniref:MENTAL domain-containing protein n=1 Tax=Amborella trichopoda TaxID=13333 RepID=W1NMK4_AMBTC|nr:uncharacterized protein LOC18424453 [Amborella trichopoda]ERM96519.1 hypothetical protein AMTR_s00001p00264010 [Amborella trichopoda]|eukprot:XP_006829103.1 uncharacterized protein LOC18424453 [Amborella trichopoda]
MGSLGRAAKTLFFIACMSASFLLVSAPALLLLTDTILPFALLSTFSHLSHQSLSSYTFRSSLLDIPLISIVRSLVITCVYSICDGVALSHGPYLGTATVCSLLSMMLLWIKALVFEGNLKQLRGAPLIFLASMVLGLSHIVVAYRISCRERRKLLIFYRIDPEAVLGSKKNGFSGYQKVKVLQEVRVQ